MKFNFIILGDVPPTKNLLRFTKNKKPYYINNEVNKYKANFALQVPSECKIHTAKPVKVYLYIFKKNNRKDGQNISACVYDSLVFAGVIENDRQIIERHEFDKIDRQNPRVEIVIENI